MTDMEIAALIEELMTYNSQEEGTHLSCRATQGSTRSDRRKEWNVDQRVYYPIQGTCLSPRAIWGSTRSDKDEEGVKCRPECLLTNKELVGSCQVGTSPTGQEAKCMCWNLCNISLCYKATEMAVHPQFGPMISRCHISKAGYYNGFLEQKRDIR